MSKEEKNTWLGVRIVQTPKNLQAYQAIIWKVKPNLIIETGVKLGGSVVFSASMLAILEACGKIKDGKVIGIDIKIMDFQIPLSNKTILFQSSSTDLNVVGRVREISKGKNVLVFLDSDHSHKHVLTELRLYAPLVSVGSYIIVNDTGLEDINYSKKVWKRKGWVKGSNPKTAVWEFLKENNDFVIDKKYNGHPDGFLKRIK